MKKDGDQYSPEETERRRDEVIRRMANTPPQPRVKAPARPKKKQKTTDSDQAARKPSARKKP